MAMRTARRLLLALLATLVAAQTAPSAQSQALVVRNVTLIDGTGAAAQPGMTVVVTGNRITAVGSNAAVPAGAQVVDGTGKFLIPGLWDMHLHLRGDSRVPRFTTYGEVLMVANGVTGVRLMAGLPKFHQIQKTNESGETYGPRIFLASRNFDGAIPTQKLPPKWGDTAGEAEEWQSVGLGEIPRAYQMTTAAQAKAAVAEAKASGVEFLKIHNELTPEAFFAIAAEAKADWPVPHRALPTGVPIVGDVRYQYAQHRAFPRHARRMLDARGRNSQRAACRVVASGPAARAAEHRASADGGGLVQCREVRRPGGAPGEEQHLAEPDVHARGGRSGSRASAMPTWPSTCSLR